jgi:hypothetical protein
MREFPPWLAPVISFGLASLVAPPARAHTGTQVGVHGGVQLLDDEVIRHQNAVSLGADVRLSFELSPLIVALSFDYFFVKDRTLFQVGASALYDLPIGHSFLYPYLGAGLGLTRFALPETESGPVPDSEVDALEESGMSVPGSPATGTDSNGVRTGLNLVAGLRFDHVELPLVRPFTQVTLTLGPIDMLTVTAGVLFELEGR